MVKNLPVTQDTHVRSLGQKDPLQEGMATCSSIPTWRIPRTEDPRELQFIGLQRVGHHWVTNTFTSHALTTNPARTPMSLTTGSVLGGSAGSPKDKLRASLPFKTFPGHYIWKTSKGTADGFFSPLRVVKLQNLWKWYRSQWFWISQLIHICCENTSNTEAYHISKKFLCKC